jgi:hypothetical protein
MAFWLFVVVKFSNDRKDNSDPGGIGQTIFRKITKLSKVSPKVSPGDVFVALASGPPLAFYACITVPTGVASGHRVPFLEL